MINYNDSEINTSPYKGIIMKIAKILTVLAFIQCVQQTHAMDRLEEDEQFFKKIVLQLKQTFPSEKPTNNNNQNETPTNTQNDNPQQAPSELK